ncbi:hypothetical protein D918_07377 [Trichuris suis]|nr:hypothetical protein D918_07377 [Trichuris suis]
MGTKDANMCEREDGHLGVPKLSARINGRSRSGDSSADADYEAIQRTFVVCRKWQFEKLNKPVTLVRKNMVFRNALSSYEAVPKSAGTW